MRALLATRHIKFPTSHARETLREGEIGLTLADLLVGLVLVRHVGRYHHACRAAGEKSADWSKVKRKSSSRLCVNAASARENRRHRIGAASPGICRGYLPRESRERCARGTPHANIHTARWLLHSLRENAKSPCHKPTSASGWRQRAFEIRPPRAADPWAPFSASKCVSVFPVSPRVDEQAHGRLSGEQSPQPSHFFSLREKPTIYLLFSACRKAGFRPVARSNGLSGSPSLRAERIFTALLAHGLSVLTGSARARPNLLCRRLRSGRLRS